MTKTASIPMIDAVLFCLNSGPRTALQVKAFLKPAVKGQPAPTLVDAKNILAELASREQVRATVLGWVLTPAGRDRLTVVTTAMLSTMSVPS